MKFMDEYRNPEMVSTLIQSIQRKATRTWKIMEICGGQTHALLRFGIDSTVYPAVQFIHGPGCPVCVTDVQKIDMAIELAQQGDTILCSFGDMLRVPGSQKSLLTARAQGASVQTVYSPLDCLKIAQDKQNKQVVFFAVGFETTAPMNAMAVKKAREMNLKNFSLLCAMVLVPPAVKALLSDPTNEIDGFLSAGHVCTVMGYWEYEPIAEQYRKPIVVTGFEPVDLLVGVNECVSMLERGEYGVRNAYRRSVRREGNPSAQRIIREVFEPCDTQWRGLGLIPQSGLRLKKEYAEFDAEKRFPFGARQDSILNQTVCIAGEILQGKKKPTDCKAFRIQCTPDNPLGAPMVSNEGACSAYYLYRLSD